MKARQTAVALLALALAACTNENEEQLIPEGPVAAQVTASIENTLTKASDNGWAPGDKIGIFTVNTTGSDGSFTPATHYVNAPYAYNGQKFEARDEKNTIYFQDTEEVEFNAYYPYQEQLGTDGLIEFSTDEVAQQDLSKIDFMFATGATASKKNPEIQFVDNSQSGGGDHSFHHCMTQIKFTFKEGDDVDFDQLISCRLEGLYLSGTFNTQDGTTSYDDTNSASLTLPLSATTKADERTAKPILLFPKQNTSDITIKVELGQQTYYATLDKSITDLQPGVCYTVNVRVTKTGLEIGGAYISSWKTVSGKDIDVTL